MCLCVYVYARLSNSRTYLYCFYPDALYDEVFYYYYYYYYFNYYLLQLSCHSLTVVLTLVQTKQIRIDMHTRNNTKHSK